MTPRARTLSLCGTLALVLFAGGLEVKVPYVGLAPGPTYDTLGSSGGQELVHVTGHEVYPTDGMLDLTTVALDDHLTLFEALGQWFDHTVAVVPREVVFPPGQSEEDAAQEVQKEMSESQRAAKTAALRYLKVPVRTTVIVDRVVPGAPAAKALRVKDVLVAIDGVKITTLADVRPLLKRNRQPGQPVSVAYLRGGVTTTVKLDTVAGTDDPTRPSIGVELHSEAAFPFDVELRLDDVGGPSAGLMFALGIIDKLTPGSLTGGVHVAGTGTIDDNGVVGPIGGITQKMIGARRKGARVFLTPDANYDEAARTVPKGLQLVRVKTLAQTVTALQQLASRA